MRASAAGKIADPSSAASLENNWIVSAIGPRMGRLTAIGWTTICKRRGGFVEGGRRDEEILGTRRLGRKWRRKDLSFWTILMNRVSVFMLI